MSAAARAFYVPGASALEWVRDRVAQALDAWAAEWMPRGAESQARAMPMSVVAAAGIHGSQAYEYQAAITDVGSLWIRCTSREKLAVSSAVVAAELLPRSTCADEWVADVVENAWQARNRQLASALLGQGSRSSLATSLTALPAHLLAAGSGCLHIACDELGLHAFIDAAVWHAASSDLRGVPAALPALVPVDTAIRRAMVQLDVVLGSAEVELPKVLDLRCGDVLRLSQRLDAGIAVLCEGRSFAHAALGRTQERLSVQILGVER